MKEPPKKENENCHCQDDPQNDSDENGTDQQVEEMIEGNKPDGPISENDTEPEKDFALFDIEREYELEDEVGLPIQAQLAKVLATLAKGMKDSDKF